MRELGIDPPPKYATDEQRDIWLQRLRDVLPKVQTFSVTINPTAVAANTTSEQTFTVTGLTANDIVTVNKPSHQTGLGIVNCRASAADTLAITFANVTGASIDPSSETYLVLAIRR